MPTVARLPLGPMVNFAPRGPNEREPPDLLRFRVTPGAILIRLQKRKLIRGFPYLPLLTHKDCPAIEFGHSLAGPYPQGFVAGPPRSVGPYHHQR